MSLKRHGILGDGPGLQSCLDMAAQAAPSMGSVLLTGETGTGKELFARAIHANSPRTDRPFVVVDCAALPGTLAEALLFGHERGAFTGAEKSRPGLIAEAHGGTLFLDEIGELPPDIQKMFLRVLQDRRFRPVAGKGEVYSDFRLISASNKNLDDLAGQGGFRGDLLYRLRSFSLHLPPLRDRLDDVPVLATAFLDRLAKEYGHGRKGVSADFMGVLCSHHWPGNIRELHQCLHSAFAKALNDETLHPVHLPMHLRVEMKRTELEQGRDEPEGLEATFPFSRDLPTLKRFRERMDSRYLRKLMLQTQGNIDEACRVSGLSRSRLYGLLKAHGIDRAGA